MTKKEEAVAKAYPTFYRSLLRIKDTNPDLFTASINVVTTSHQEVDEFFDSLKAGDKKQSQKLSDDSDS